MRKILILIATLLFPGIQSTSHANAQSPFNEFSVKITNTEWPPYVYVEKGEIKGSAYKISSDVLKRAGISFDFQILPWNRVYHLGLSEKNYLISGMGRTVKREKLFHWIGPVTNGLDVFFYKRKSTHLQIKNIDKAKYFKIGVLRGGYNQDYLYDNGFKSKRIINVSNQHQLWEMLKKNRLPFILMPTNLEPPDLKNSLFERAMFAFRITDYLAASKKTPIELIQKLKSAYNELKKEGQITLE